MVLSSVSIAPRSRGELSCGGDGVSCSHIFTPDRIAGFPAPSDEPGKSAGSSEASAQFSADTVEAEYKQIARKHAIRKAILGENKQTYTALAMNTGLRLLVFGYLSKVRRRILPASQDLVNNLSPRFSLKSLTFEKGSGLRAHTCAHIQKGAGASTGTRPKVL